MDISMTIKRCPFCDGEGILTDISNADGQGYKVICQNCNASTTMGNVIDWDDSKSFTELVRVGIQNKEKSIKVAILNWNHRTGAL